MDAFALTACGNGNERKKAPVFDYLVPCMQCLGHLLVDKRRLYMVWRNLQAQYSPLVSLLSPSLSAE